MKELTELAKLIQTLGEIAEKSLMVLAEQARELNELRQTVAALTGNVSELKTKLGILEGTTALACSLVCQVSPDFHHKFKGIVDACLNDFVGEGSGYSLINRHLFALRAFITEGTNATPFLKLLTSAKDTGQSSEQGKCENEGPLSPHKGDA